MNNTATLAALLLTAAAIGEPANDIGPPTPTPPAATQPAPSQPAPSQPAGTTDHRPSLVPQTLPPVSDVRFTSGDSATGLTNPAATPTEPANTITPVSAPAPSPAAPSKPHVSDPLSMGLKPKPSIENRPLGSSTVPNERELLADTKPSTAASASDLGISRTILATAGVVALILLVAGVYRKFAARGTSLAAALGAGGKAPSGVLSVLGRYPVARGTTLVLFRLDRRVLLVAQTKHAGLSRFGSTTTMQTLCEITDPTEVASILAKAGDTSGPLPTIASRFESELEEASKMTPETPIVKGDPMPARTTTAPVSAALAAIRRAAAAQAQPEPRRETTIDTSKPASRPAAAAAALYAAQSAARQTAKVAAREPSQESAQHDPAAELRRRLAAMRAPAAIDLGRREFVG